jgi:hypothetical protein
MTNNEFYKMRLRKDNPWHNIIEHEYTTYTKLYKPRAVAVTYLMYSGMSHSGAESNYFTEDMADSYANAFQVHQKPCRTAYIHKYWIRKLPYFWYLLLVAAPVDIYAHTYQLVFGEHDIFLEGGAFFIPYQISHWSMLSFALISHSVYNHIPIQYWCCYFDFIRWNLIVHEYIYKYTLRKLSLFDRICEFCLFVYFAMTIYNVLTPSVIPDSEKQVMVLM